MSGKTLIIPNKIGGDRLARPHNENFNAVADVLNGNVGSDNLTIDAVGSVNLKAGAANTRALGQGAVTPSRMSDVFCGAAFKTANSNNLAYATAGEWKVVPRANSTSFPLELTLTPPENCKILIHGMLKIRTNAAATLPRYLSAAIHRKVGEGEFVMIGQTSHYETHDVAVTAPVMATCDVTGGIIHKFQLRFASNKAGAVNVEGAADIFFTGLSYQLLPSKAPNE